MDATNPDAVNPPKLSLMLPVPALLTADEAYVYRERLSILMGANREATDWDRDLAMSDVLRMRREASATGEVFRPDAGRAANGELF